jgi:CDP-glucose 4,6-dehydratase
MVQSAFQGKRVLVTGHTGFKGAWLALWLHHLGAEVTGFALPPPTRPSLFEALDPARKMRHREGDIRDLPALERVFEEADPEVVFHLAAQSLVRRSYEDPKTTFDTNVGGTVNLFEVVRRHGRVRALVNVTSDKCYANQEWVWGYRETDSLGGSDPYSASKACAELVFAAYQKSFFPPGCGLGLASARAGNVVGGGDWAADRLVPDCVRAFHEGRTVGIRNPDAVRPWQHVLEPLGGYLLLAAQLLQDPVAWSGAWNFGPAPQSCRPVREVADSVARAWRNARWEDLSEWQAGNSAETRLLRLCCDKATNLLGWQPLWDFRRTIFRTVHWYRRFYQAPGLATQLCLEQIEEYSASAGWLDQGLGVTPSGPLAA